MHSVAIESDNVQAVKQLVPVGVEKYVVAKGGQTYLNVRTSDPDLLARLKQAAQARHA
jgi:hypothetical protein